MRKCIVFVLVFVLTLSSVQARPHYRYRYDDYCYRPPRRVEVHHYEHRHHHCWHGRDYAKFFGGMVLGAALNEASQSRNTVVIPYERPIYVPTPQAYLQFQTTVVQPVQRVEVVQVPQQPIVQEIQIVRPVQKVTAVTTTTPTTSIIRQISY